jgi:hypothetical protein
MQEHYSTVQIEEMRASIGKIISIAKVREALAARARKSGGAQSGVHGVQTEKRPVSDAR